MTYQEFVVQIRAILYPAENEQEPFSEEMASDIADLLSEVSFTDCWQALPSQVDLEKTPSEANAYMRGWRDACRAYVWVDLGKLMAEAHRGKAG